MNPAVFTFSEFALAALIAGIYFCLGKFGLSLAFINASATAVWPCTGFALAAVLLLREKKFRLPGSVPKQGTARLWSPSPAEVGLFVGAFFVNWATTGDIPSSFGIALGNTLEAVFGAYLMQRFANGVHAFDRVPDIFRFIFLAAVPSTVVSATIGVSNLVAFNLAGKTSFQEVWLTWWLGDLVSDLILVPLLVLWLTRSFKEIKSRDWIQMTCTLALVFLAAEWVFGAWAEPGQALRLAFIQLPLFACIGLQFGQRMSISAAFVTSAIAIFGTLNYQGPFAWENQNEALMVLQAFISLLTITTLVLSAMVKERRNVEKKSRLREERYRSLVTASSQIVWVANPHGQMFEDSPTWRQFTGQTYEEMKGSGWINALHPEDQETMRGEQKTAVHEATPRTLQYRLRNSEGVFRHMSVRAVPVLDKDGSLREWVGTSTDVTDTQRAERDNTLLLSLGQKLNAATTAQEAGQIIVEAAQDLFGWDACFIYLLNEKGGLYPVVNFDTVDGKKVPVEPVYFGSKPSHVAQEVIERGAKLVLRDEPKFLPNAAIPFGDKSRPSASLIYVPLRNAEQVVGLLSIQSYTPHAYTSANLAALQSLADYCGGALERIRTTEALRESEAEFRTLCESSPLGIFKTDGQARCTYHNSRLLALSESTVEEAMGDGWANTVHPDDRAMVVADWEKARAGSRECCNEHRVLTKNGKLRWVRTLAQPIIGPDGKLAGYVGCVEDITERKRADEELKIAQQKLKDHANELEQRVQERTAELQETVHSLESFSYSIAHDLRAPLRAIQGLTAVMADEYAPKLDETAVDLSRRIVESAARMDNLIEDLLSYSRLSREEMVLSATHMEPAVKMVMDQLSNEIKVTHATIEVCRPLPVVCANAVVIEQVLVNLISNAIKFMPKNVTPYIRIRSERMTIDARGPRVRIWIEDNGIGIAPQHHQRIFGVFQRLHAATTYPGTGIGLAIVRKGVERMGGRVGLESELNKGSRFWIELPSA